MKIFLFTKPVIWLIIICYGLFLPAGNIPAKAFIAIPHFDKLVHFTLFFVFCLLLYRPLKRLQVKHLLIAPLTAILMGAVLEYLQRIVTVTRSSDIADFFANVSGIIFSVLFFHFFISDKKWEKYF